MKENERTVTSILSMNPGCQAQYVLQRMIGASISNDLFTRFYNSKWMEIIKSEQQEDGSFGRFHTMDSSVKKRIPTTERAVDSIKYLLLPRGNDFVDKLCLYMENILSKSLPWPDGFEQNKYYKAAQPLFVAAKLSVFGSQNKEFHSLFNTWHTILSESFSSGEYSKDRNNEVAKELLGTEIDDSYIGLHSIYTIEFFSNTQASLEAPLKEAYLHWLHTNNRSIHYTNINFTFIDNYTFSDLFRVLFLLSKFSCFKKEFNDMVIRIESEADEKGLWNYGKKFAGPKISDDWRTVDKMTIDHTLLTKMILP